METDSRSPKTRDPARERPALLKLPLELREMIYQHLLLVGVVCIGPVVLPHKDPYYSDPSRSPDPPHYRRSTFRSEWQLPNEGTYSRINPQVSDRPSLNVLETCREIYNESASYFYSKNIFFFGQFDKGFRYQEPRSPIQAAVAFLEDRPTCALEWIKHIKIGFGAGVQCHCRAELRHDFLHLSASDEDVKRFYTVVRDRLKLNHLSILIRGWPLDVRPGRMGFDYGPDTRQRDGDQWILKRSLIQLNHLLSLGQFSRLSVEIHAQRPGGIFAAERISFHPGRLVAFATLLRSRLLRGGEALGTVNISVHERHDAKVYYPVGDFQEAVCRREKWRVFVVRCDDNDSGKSLLAPAKRLPRMLNQDPHDSAWLRSRLSGPQSRREFAFAFPFDGRGLVREWDPLDWLFGGPSFLPEYREIRGLILRPKSPDDYNDSDDGETDSLKDIELDAEDVEHLPPEAFM
ncbi:hypothetical protein IWX48DRAFT_390125 [Phyllosticta citricarpa]